jgi:NAD-dependent SIR2 family protein deacetylase
MKFIQRLRHSESENGYLNSIRKGMKAASNVREVRGEDVDRTQALQNLKKVLQEADAVIIGAGAGLSTSAGFVYNGNTFHTYFADFIQKYGISDMYSGGFYPFDRKEIFWAWWARHIYVNRYMDAPKPVYQELFDLVKGQDYFVLTTNVDHQFQKAGFDKSRLFYTQGDYGLFQSADGKIRKTYDNEDWVYSAMEAQGFVKDETGVYRLPAEGSLKMEIPTALIPVNPDDGSAMTTNLRADDLFVEDEGWHRASAAYEEYLEKHSSGKTVYLELGVGMNTPVIIKYPFWAFTEENPEAVYVCLNYGEAMTPKQISDRSICINGDIGDILKELA